MSTRGWIGKVVFCLGLAATTGTASQAQLALAPNDPAPALTGYWHPSLEPHRVDWSAHKLTLVSFWADWCEPCKEMMPMLQKLYDERAADGLYVVGVHNPEVHPDKVTAFLEPLDVTYPILRELAFVIIKIGEHDVQIAGHTDSAPSPDQSNWMLGARRAVNILEYLMELEVEGKMILPDRISAVSYGSTRPMADNSTPENRAKNRRVEVILREHMKAKAYQD